MKKFALLTLTVLLCLQGFAEDFPYTEAADRCTNVLASKFLNKDKGTFYSSPDDVGHSSQYLYWQQAHAMDVLIYSFERIQRTDPQRASTYRTYMERWFNNHANNYHHDTNDPTGFSNPFTDDMCWICLTLIHMSEALEDVEYANTAKYVYDNFIITRAWTDSQGTGLPWNSYEDGKHRNACTNSPGCHLAIGLYELYGEQKYLEDAIMLYDYVVNALLASDGRVEEPPLSYTQGTFGEACRRLYYITGESKYSQTASNVLLYAFISDRCTREGLLRDEGVADDQSIFKAVLIPYAVNFVLDEDMVARTRNRIRNKLIANASTLWDKLDHEEDSTSMFCNYWWGEPFTQEMGAPSMGAQASGASLMENIARMFIEESADIPFIAGDEQDAQEANPIYDLYCRQVDKSQDLYPGVFIRSGKKYLVK